MNASFRKDDGLWARVRAFHDELERVVMLSDEFRDYLVARHGAHPVEKCTCVDMLFKTLLTRTVAVGESLQLFDHAITSAGVKLLNHGRPQPLELPSETLHPVGKEVH